MVDFGLYLFYCSSFSKKIRKIRNIVPYLLTTAVFLTVSFRYVAW